MEQIGGRACPNCGRFWGAGRTCQFCHQVDGMPLGVRLSSPGKRFGGFLLDWIIANVLMFGLWIGPPMGESEAGSTLVKIGFAGWLIWFVWYIAAMTRGQTPAKMLIGMHVLHTTTGTPSGFWRMVLRDCIARSIIAVLSAFLLLIPYFWLIWDKDNQELWDKIADTIVVDGYTKAARAYVAGRPMTSEILVPAEPQEARTLS